MLSRFRAGARRAGHELLRQLRRLDELAGSLHRKLAGCDAMIAPTVAATAAPVAGLLDSESAYSRANAAMLRNTTPGNLTRLCALTLPCGVDDCGLPAGLMLMQRPNREEALLRLGKAAETALADVTQAA